MPRISPNKSDKYLIFRETFDSVKSVVDGGGTIVGNSVANGKFSGDGTSAYEVYYPSHNQIYGTIWSARFRFRLNAYDVPGFSALVAKDIAAARGFVFGVTNDAKPYIEINGTALAITGVTGNISLDTTHEMVITSDGTNVRAYVDTVQNGTTGATASIARVTGNLSVGRREYVGQERFFDGDIFDFDFWQGVALTAEEIKDLYENDVYAELELPLIASDFRSWYYDGSNVAKTKNKGTLGGELTLGDGSTTTTFPTQLTPHGMRFDGGDYVDIGLPITNTNQPWTFSTYVNLKKATGVASEFLSNYKSAIIPSILIQQLSATGLMVYVFSSTGNLKSTTFTFPNVDWSGVISVSNDGSLAVGGINLYLNGVKQTAVSASMSGTLAATTITENLRIGKDADNTNYFQAGNIMREFKFHCFEITPMQVRKLHNDMLANINI